MTRSDVRASLDYRREAVVDDDLDVLGAAVGGRGVDGDPAHEQLNDLAALGVREVPREAFTDLCEHILGDGVVGKVLIGFEIGQPLIQRL